MGFTMINHKGKQIVTSLNSSFDDFVSNMNNLNFEVVRIPAGFEHRPDLISDIFYDTPTFDWLISMFNNISDPFDGFNPGDLLLIPIL